LCSFDRLSPNRDKATACGHVIAAVPTNSDITAAACGNVIAAVPTNSDITAVARGWSNAVFVQIVIAATDGIATIVCPAENNLVSVR
jgi:hypothetical protein